MRNGEMKEARDRRGGAVVGHGGKELKGWRIQVRRWQKRVRRGLKVESSAEVSDAMGSRKNERAMEQDNT